MSRAERRRLRAVVEKAIARELRKWDGECVISPRSAEAMAPKIATVVFAAISRNEKGTKT